MTFVLALAASALMAEPARRPEFQSAKIIQTVSPVFPESLVAVCRNGGQARVVLSVDADGRLNEWLVISHTRREFAEAAVSALREWSFEPARLRGEAVSVSIELTFHFEVRGDVTVSFYIDEQGAVRMPYVLGQPNLELADLAVEAVRQWKFEPPTRQGRPVLVHAQQLFRFNRATAPKG